MLKVLGIFLMVLILYGISLGVTVTDPTTNLAQNHRSLAIRIGTLGVLVLGVAPLIISGGIDLSIGSVVGLAAVSLALLIERHIAPPFAVLIILACAPLIGLIHGLLVTRLRLQPFLVTLC